MKKRLDLLMVERALAPSREKAKAYIMSGDVYVDGQKEDKAGTMFKETVKIEVRGNTLPYVSRGGLKLEKAMNNFGVSLDGKSIQSMSDMDSLTGNFVMIREWYVWKKRISVMYFRKICRSRHSFHRYMFLSFL